MAALFAALAIGLGAMVVAQRSRTLAWYLPAAAVTISLMLSALVIVHRSPHFDQRMRRIVWVCLLPVLKVIVGFFYLKR